MSIEGNEDKVRRKERVVVEESRRRRWRVSSGIVSRSLQMKKEHLLIGYRERAV